MTPEEYDETLFAVRRQALAKVAKVADLTADEAASLGLGEPSFQKEIRIERKNDKSEV